MKALRWLLQTGEYDPSNQGVTPSSGNVFHDLGRPDPFEGAVASVSRDPALVAMYQPDGSRAYVPLAEVGDWESKGWRVTQRDIRALCDELPVRFSAAHEALDALIRCVEIDGELDPHEEAQLHTARVACAEVAGAMMAILQDAEVGYPVKQGAGVLMRDRDGVEHRVDPNQAEQFRSRPYYWEVVNA